MLAHLLSLNTFFIYILGDSSTVSFTDDILGVHIFENCLILATLAVEKNTAQG